MPLPSSWARPRYPRHWGASGERQVADAEVRFEDARAPLFGFHLMVDQVGDERLPVLFG